MIHCIHTYFAFVSSERQFLVYLTYSGLSAAATEGRRFAEVGNGADENVAGEKSEGFSTPSAVEGALPPLPAELRRVRQLSTESCNEGEEEASQPPVMKRSVTAPAQL